MTPRPPANSAAPRKIVKLLLAPMSLLRVAGSLKMFVAARDEHDANHQAQEQKSNIGELGQLRDDHTSYSESLPVFTHVPPAGAGQIASDVGQITTKSVGHVALPDIWFLLEIHFSGKRCQLNRSMQHLL